MRPLRNRGDRGSAAVEFALILPVFVLLVFGGIEFAYLYNQQVELTGAARSAARVMAISDSPNAAAAAAAAAVDAAPSVNGLTTDDVTFSSATCPHGGTISVTVSYESDSLVGWLPWMGSLTSFSVDGRAAMPCGG